MYKTFLYLALALLLALPVRAGLTVVVAADGWQGDNDLLGQDAYYTSVRYDHWLYGGEEALATLLTGVNPCEHGVCSNWAFSRETRQEENIFLSDQPLAIGTKQSYGADALLAPTITDRLRLRYGPATRIYAIGLEPAATILLAGHSANACCWLGPSLRNDSLRWVSTSYYREGLPSVADQWNTTPNRFTDSPIHRFPNSSVINLALSLQQDRHLGEAVQPDMLLMHLSLVGPKADYTRFCQDISRLVQELQQRLGREAVRVVVMGLPKGLTAPEYLAEYHLKPQVVEMDRVVALTSMYLMALYGSERWIDGGSGHALYLNHTAIEEQHLSLETVRRQVAEFLMQFDGIRYACPAAEAYLQADLAPSLYKRFTGDVVFDLQPNATLLSATGYLLPVSSPIVLYPAPSHPITTATDVAGYIY